MSRAGITATEAAGMIGYSVSGVTRALSGQHRGKSRIVDELHRLFCSEPETLSVEERQLLSAYRELVPGNRDLVRGMAIALRGVTTREILEITAVDSDDDDGDEVTPRQHKK